MGPLTLSKDALREEETIWLIKCPGEGNLNDVGHFNTPLMCDNFGQTRVQQREEKAHHCMQTRSDTM